MKYWASILLFSFFYQPINFSTTFSFEEGLVAYYSFNQCDARDDSGNGSDGKLYGGVGCWCGIEEDGLLFDGGDDYVVFEGPVNRYFNTGDFTISLFFRPTGQATIYKQSLLSKREVCDEYNMLDILLAKPDRKVETEVHETPRKDYPEISPEYMEKGWKHFALVRRGVRAFTFINGHLQKSGTRCSGVDITNDSQLSLSNSICIGEGGVKRFKGVIDELRIYDKALTEEEVMLLYMQTPVENAEQDCYTFQPKKINKDPLFTEETNYLCD